jgi:murein DD-endopeptidase MepM/ murein hydrolase activator NlpD
MTRDAALARVTVIHNVVRLIVATLLLLGLAAGPRQARGDRPRGGAQVPATGPAARAETIDAEAARFQDATVEVAPLRRAQEWRLPFPTKDRGSLRTVRVVSTFGAKRQSYLAGHLHTALDLEPSPRAEGARVLPLAHGVVCSIHLADPHLTVVVKHHLPDGAVCFSSYKHLAEAYVRPGQQVTPDTPLGRLFTRRETRRFRGSFDHLHLEIRTRFDDHGVASWLTMTRAELDGRFVDPLSFLRARLGRRDAAGPPARERASAQAK